jgi:hypothetical protein
MAKRDHIKVRRLGYIHHGIDLDNCYDIHYSGEPAQRQMHELK